MSLFSEAPPGPDGSLQAVYQAAEALRQGQLVVFPTETVYGLGASLAHPEAVQRIFTCKQRPSGHPLIVHIASTPEARALAAEWPPVAEVLARAFWPGPLTLIVPKAAHVPDVVTGGRPTVGLRVPAHPVALALLSEMAGVGVAAPSANRFQKLSPTLTSHVRQAFSPTDVPIILEGGAARIGLESTIVACDDKGLTLLRPGAITALQLTEATGLTVHYHPSQQGEAPGLLTTHYQGEKPLRLLSRNDLLDTLATWQLTAANDVSLAEGVLVLASFEPQAALPYGVRWLNRLPPHDDVAGYAQCLYALLHWADQQPEASLWLQAPPLTPEGLACWDRLSRMLGQLPPVPGTLYA